MFAEAIYNLVHNALRYTESGGHVGLIVDGTDVIVWDTGMGVCDEEKRIIWHDAVRGSNVDVESDGIGLAVARNAVYSANEIVAMCSPLPVTIDPRPADKRDMPGALFRLTFPRASFETVDS